MRVRCARERALPDLRLPQSKVLKSLDKHWSGLTVFVDHQEVPLDNNTAERAQRGPVVGRKNYYGSGSLWSGRLVPARRDSRCSRRFSFGKWMSAVG